MTSRSKVWLGRAAVLVGLASLWEIAGLLGWVSPLVLPPLHDVVGTLVDDLMTGTVLEETGQTLSRLLMAMAIGTLLGLALGVLFWRLPSVGRGLEPLVASLYAVPWIFFYPLLLLLFGINNAPIIFLAAIRVLVPVTLNVLVGLRDVPPIYYKVGQVFGLSTRQVLGKVVTPAAAAYLMAGIELGAIYGFLSVVGTEFLISDRGLGYAISQDYHLYRITEMYAYVLVMVVIAFFFNALRENALKRLRGD